MYQLRVWAQVPDAFIAIDSLLSVNCNQPVLSVCTRLAPGEPSLMPYISARLARLKDLYFISRRQCLSLVSLSSLGADLR